MRLVKPSFEILTDLEQSYKIPMFIERIGRVCYKSEDKIGPDTASRFVSQIIENGHHSVIEHFNLTVHFVCDRGVSHELVRHRLASFSQESTRFCNYKGGVTFVIPPWVDIEPGEYFYAVDAVLPDDNNPSFWWVNSMLRAEREYSKLLNLGWSPQQARAVLPNSLKTEIIVTANLREWRHILNLRCSKAAHPQCREIMVPLLVKLKTSLPEFFNNIHPKGVER